MRLSHENRNVAVGMPSATAARTQGRAIELCTCEPLNTSVGASVCIVSIASSVVRRTWLDRRSSRDSHSKPVRLANG